MSYIIVFSFDSQVSFYIQNHSLLAQGSDQPFFTQEHGCRAEYHVQQNAF